MATAFAVGSMLASGASTAGLATTIGGISLSNIGIGLGIAGQVFGAFEQAGAASAAAQSEAMAAESRAIEFDLQAEREQTQSALESLERERGLRQVLAAQRARFGGSGIDPFSGSPVRIQEVTESEVRRQDRQAGLFSALTVSQLNAQAAQERAAGAAALSAGKTKSKSALFSGLSSAGQMFGDFKPLIK